MKTDILLVFLIISLLSCSSRKKQELLKNDIELISKQVDSMYKIDQDYRNKIMEIISQNKDLKSSSIDYNKKKDSIWKLTKKSDSLNTKRIIQIIKKYGFPSNERLNKKKAKAYFILVHSPKEFHKEIRELIEREYKEKRIDEYKKEYIFWHLNGRGKSPPIKGLNGKINY